MMHLTKKPLMRVVPGPDPSQFGIIAKPYKPPTENIIEKNRRVEEARVKIGQYENELGKELLKTTFFDNSTKKSKLKHIKRTVDEIMNQRNFLLNERRNKLKQMLHNEQIQHERELEGLMETPLERAAKLRERARLIKEERHREKEEYVNEKLDQKWRLECDELRNLQSKQLQAEMGVEHIRQMEEKVEREKDRLKDEAMYADMWYNDMLIKKQREDIEAQKTHDRNQATVKVLREQMQVLEQQKEEEKRLRLENIKLFQERLDIDKIEKEMAHQEKMRQQAARKQELDQSVRIKLRNQARRAQEEMALDLKLLEDALATTKTEEDDRLRRKHELMEEGKRYREFLKIQLEEEKRREKEIEQIIDAEVEKQFQKRLAQWKAEKEARQKLLQDVLRERRQQVEDKIRRNEERQRELELEKIEVNATIERYKQLEREEQRKVWENNRNFQSDLIGQMEYNSVQKQRNKWQDYAEYQACVRAEEDYQNRLQYNLQTMKLDNLHPIRHWSNTQQNIKAFEQNNNKQ